MYIYIYVPYDYKDDVPLEGPLSTSSWSHCNGRPRPSPAPSPDAAPGDHPETRQPPKWATNARSNLSASCSESCSESCSWMQLDAAGTWRVWHSLKIGWRDLNRFLKACNFMLQGWYEYPFEENPLKSVSDRQTFFFWTIEKAPADLRTIEFLRSALSGTGKIRTALDISYH